MPRLVILPLLPALALALPPGPEEGAPARPGPPARLTRDGLDKQRPAWAPDGQRLLFARHESDGAHIWQYLLAPGPPQGGPRRLTDRKTPEYNGVFSPDGSRVLFVAITLS